MMDEKGKWDKLYTYVLMWNAFLIVLFYIITKTFTH